ncbi:MAG: hypothetical protein V4699_02080, partial [Patescibacteria group bacterium]
MTKINYQKIYSHMTYTIKELSNELGVNEKTCLRWIANGLKIIAGSKKPILIMGYDAKKFLRNKDSKKKVKLKRNEFYCLPCRAPRRAKRGSIKKLKNKKTGICHVCNGKMCRIFEPYQK